MADRAAEFAGTDQRCAGASVRAPGTRHRHASCGCFACAAVLGLECPPDPVGDFVRGLLSGDFAQGRGGWTGLHELASGQHEAAGKRERPPTFDALPAVSLPLFSLPLAAFPCVFHCRSLPFPCVFPCRSLPFLVCFHCHSVPSNSAPFSTAPGLLEAAVAAAARLWGLECVVGVERRTASMVAARRPARRALAALLAEGLSRAGGAAALTLALAVRAGHIAAPTACLQPTRLCLLARPPLLCVPSPCRPGGSRCRAALPPGVCTHRWVARGLRPPWCSLFSSAWGSAPHRIAGNCKGEQQPWRCCVNTLPWPPAGRRRGRYDGGAARACDGVRPAGRGVRSPAGTALEVRGASLLPALPLCWAGEARGTRGPRGGGEERGGAARVLSPHRLPRAQVRTTAVGGPAGSWPARRWGRAGGAVVARTPRCAGGSGWVGGGAGDPAAVRALPLHTSSRFGAACCCVLCAVRLAFWPWG